MCYKFLGGGEGKKTITRKRGKKGKKKKGERKREKRWETKKEEK